MGTIYRDVVQFGSTRDLGSRGCRFKSCHSDFETKYRDVVQFGRTLGSGLRGRKFESCHSDHVAD